MSAKTPFIRFGDFVFKWRNYLFPGLVLGLILAFPPSPPGTGRWPLLLAGGALMAAGLALRFWTIGWAYIKRGGVAKKVYADDLVTAGVFALCRNPLYLGNLLIYIGLFACHGASGTLFLGTLAFALCYQSLVAAEEFFLRGKFGPGYDAYAADVPRWWPALSGLGARWRAGREGLSFDWRRAVTKDYSTMASSLLALWLVAALRLWRWEGSAGLISAALPLGGALALILLFTALAKRYKSHSLAAV